MMLTDHGLPHETCYRPGKFDCDIDEAVYQFTLDSGGGEGDVQAPCAWFEPIDLVTECAGHESLGGAHMGESTYCNGSCEQEWHYAMHYGGAWLIARENESGRFWVEAYATEQARDERVEDLRAAWAEWDGGVL